MINYILLVITLICTAFNIYLTMIEGGFKRGYDKGLEDGIRFTNAANEENKANDCEGCYGELFGDCYGCAKNIDCPGR